MNVVLCQAVLLTKKKNLMRINVLNVKDLSIGINNIMMINCQLIYHDI